MTMPDEIHACQITSKMIVGAYTHITGIWHNGEGSSTVAYIRKDIVDALREENKALREALEMARDKIKWGLSTLESYQADAGDDYHLCPVCLSMREAISTSNKALGDKQ